MDTLNRQQRIGDLLGTFSYQVDIGQSGSFFDLSRTAQSVMCRLLSIILDLPDLKNLDNTERQNFPAIDLGDRIKRVAIQVTGDGSGAKVRDTVEKFFAHRLDEHFDSLKLYILTSAQDTYTANFRSILSPGFDFDLNRDVMDRRFLLRTIQRLKVEKQREVLEILEEEFGEVGWARSAMPTVEIERNLSVFVRPTQYDQAIEILKNSGFLILSGPPHIGKTSAAINLLATLGAVGKESILRLEADQALRGVLTLDNRFILIDDAFGKLNFDIHSAANDFDRLRLLSHRNLVVLTSREAVLDRAKRNSRLGESPNLDRITVSMRQEGSFGSIALQEILVRHIDYYSKPRFERPEPIDARTAAALRVNAGYIVSQLRFPHNVGNLVKRWDTHIDFQAHFVEQVEAAKNIIGAAQTWFGSLQPLERIRIAITSLLPRQDKAALHKLLEMTGVSTVNERLLAKCSGGFLEFTQSLRIVHPSYLEGFIESLQGDHLTDASFVLRKAAEAITDYSFDQLSALLVAKNLLHREGTYYAGDLSDESMDSHQYFARFVDTYNNLIDAEFPILRVIFQPHSPDPARVHLYLGPSGYITCWSLFPRDDGVSVTESVEDMTKKDFLWTEIERHYLKLGSLIRATRYHDARTSTTIPEIEAFRLVLRQLKDVLKSKSGIPVGQTLEIGQLFSDLRTTDFPVEQISIEWPLTADRIKDWFEPILDSLAQRSWPAGRTVPPNAVIKPDEGIVNELSVYWAMDLLETLQQSGIVVDRDILVQPDHTWEDRPYKHGMVTDADRYSDEQLVLAIETGFLAYYRAVSEFTERAFPRLAEKIRRNQLTPVSLLCIVDRDKEDHMGRPHIFYAAKSAGPRTEVATVETHLITPGTQQTERDAIYSVRDVFKKSEDLLYTGSISFSMLTRFDEWSQWIMRDVQMAIDEIINELDPLVM